MQNRLMSQFNTEISKQIIHFNSKFRQNYYTTKSSNFKYNFPLAMNNVKSLRLRSIDIPNTWYTFSHKIGNNKFIIETFLDSQHNIFEIIIPDGNHTARHLMEYINNTYLHLSESDNDLKYLKFTISEQSLKSKFEVIKVPTKPFTFNLKFAMPNTKTIMYGSGWLFGFRMGQYLNNKRELESEGLFDAGGDRYVYICLEDYNKNHVDNNIIFLDNTFIDKNVIGKMYLHNGKFNININDNDGSANLKKREFHGPVDIKTIELKILDEYGNIIDLNNMDFSFSIEFEKVYRKCYKNFTR